MKNTSNLKSPRSGIHHPEITGLYTVGLYVTIVEMEKILCNHCTLFLRR